MISNDSLDSLIRQTALDLASDLLATRDKVAALRRWWLTVYVMYTNAKPPDEPAPVMPTPVAPPVYKFQPEPFPLDAEYIETLKDY